jgi:hypothetical protein
MLHGREGSLVYGAITDFSFVSAHTQYEVQEVSGNQAKKPSDLAVRRARFKNSRVDKTAIELFLAGVRGWEAGVACR